MSLLVKAVQSGLGLTEQFLRPSVCSILCSANYTPVKKGQSRDMFKAPKEPKEWLRYNEVVYSPRGESEPRRPAEITYYKPNIKYSPTKLWYMASMIRGMSVDEAIKQLTFHRRGGAYHVKEAIEEAVEIAIKDYNVEYRSNLWIEDSYGLRGHKLYGLMKRAGNRYNMIRYRYSHYCVRLREGRPPKHYYQPLPTGTQKMDDHIKSLRDRKIPYSL